MASLDTVPTFKLKSGLELCRVINGCWQLAGGHGPVTSKVLDDFENLVSHGFTSFDTADIYGPSEAILGKFRELHSSRVSSTTGQVPSLQMCTKFVPSYSSLRNFRPIFAEKSIERSIRKLGVNCIDLVALHWWDYNLKSQLLGACRALIDLQNAGRLRAIGVTNMDTDRLKFLVDNNVNVESNQIQYSVIDRRPENGPMASYCKDNDIKLICYGPLAGGFLSSKWLGISKPTKSSFQTVSQAKYWTIIEQFGGWDHFQELLQVLATIGNKHSVSISNVAARWVLQRPAVGGVIIGVRNAEHVQDNKRLFQFTLDADDIAAIDAAKGAGPKGDCYTLERGG